LEITENIDLSKAIDIKDMAYGGIAGAVRIYFPTGSLKMQIIENGELINTLNETYVEVFYDKTNDIDKYRLISRLNELIAGIHKTKNKPYDAWLLQAYYYYRPYDASKKGEFLQELVSINNPYGVYEQAFKYYKQKDNTNARIWLQKAIDLGNYDGYFWLASTYFATDKNEHERLSQKGIDLNSFLLLKTSADFDYERKGDYKNAIYYAEKAIKKGHPFKLSYADAYVELCRYYIKNGDFEKVKEILLDENTYGSGLSEVEIFNISYDLLIESGNCKEALAFLNQMANGIYTNEVKNVVYTKLEYLYTNGCKGEDGSKVKKDKKLANESASMQYSFSKKQ
jgi:TPR repeat protein